MPKLKSSYRPATPPPAPPPLPEGWVEYSAPGGHTYYYHTETGFSTYERPTTRLLSHQPQATASWNAQFQPSVEPQPVQAAGDRREEFRRTRRGHHEAKKHQDRTRRRYNLPGCEPWILVTTKLGRRFVHNTETRKSLWKAPEHVERSLIQYDLRNRRHQERRDRGEPSDSENEATKGSLPVIASAEAADGGQQDGSASEYEEVEVTDSEGERDEDEYATAPGKRQRTEEPVPEGPVEFGEDDIAYQLQAMEEDYGLDPGEFGEDNLGDDVGGGEAGLPLTDAEQDAAFRSLLDDYGINPYGIWERIVEESPIVDDERYTMLPNMKARRKCFTTWAKERVEELKEQRKNETPVDPKEGFMQFLKEHATPKLYWPEFRRKFRKEPAMNDRKISDRDREKMYRDFVRGLKK